MTAGVLEKCERGRDRPDARAAFEPRRLASNDCYLRIPAGWSRRLADLADPDPGRLIWADNAHLGVASERPQSAPMPPFHCEREIAFNAQRRPYRAFFVLEIASQSSCRKSKSFYSKGALGCDGVGAADS